MFPTNSLHFPQTMNPTGFGARSQQRIVSTLALPLKISAAPQKPHRIRLCLFSLVTLWCPPAQMAREPPSCIKVLMLLVVFVASCSEILEQNIDASDLPSKKSRSSSSIYIYSTKDHIEDLTSLKHPKKNGSSL